MQPLSAVIITRNEAHNIGRCLRSVKDVCEEVIVVDAESTDDTRAIAEGLGARVVVRAWTDYSDQKNHANGLATHDHLFSLDADEELSQELRDSILGLKRTGFQGAYSMHRLTNYAGSWVRHGGWYPDTKVRIFPRDGARWVGAHVHESLLLDGGVTTTLLRGDLLHYSYHSVEDHRQRIERYSDLHARRMLAEGRSAGLVKLWLSPVAKFIQGYILQLGFLDGRAGYDIARFSARAVHLKYAKLNALRGGQAS